MNIQSELKKFISHFVSDQSTHIIEAIELNSFNQINVEKLLALGLNENYVFRMKDAWKAWLARAALAYEDAELNAICDERKDQKRVSVNIEDL